MSPSRLELRIRLLVVCLAGLVIATFAAVGWVILLEAEDAIHDRYFATAAADLAAGRSGTSPVAGLSAHADASFLRDKMGLREIPTNPGLHDIFANDDLSRSEVIRSFPDRIRLWFVLGYEREYRLWIPPRESAGDIRAVLADLSTLEVSEAATDEATRRLLILSAVLFLLALAASHLITRWTLGPVRRLTQLVLGDPADPAVSRFRESLPGDEVGQLAAALDSYRQRLGEALARERHFLSDCSHELRTPIATLRSALDLHGKSGGDPASGGRLLAQMRRTAQRMERLVQTFLLLAREQTPPADACAVDVGAMVRQVVEEIRALHPGHPLRIAVAVHCPSNATLSIHGESLAVLCHNLVGNAYIHAGGGNLEITVRKEEGSVSIAFEDDGPGLPERSSAPSAAGHGIGLSLVERICRARGWTFNRGPGALGGARLEIRIPG
jgi:signal transduction histidine kinase